MSASAIHHLNCGSMCPWGRRLINGDGSPLAPAEILCHVLLVESSDGLVLVDTGFGLAEAEDPRRIPLTFRAMMRPQRMPEGAAISQVRKLGFDPADVRHIVVTHLDIDHSGGLPDFPQAMVHVFAREHETAFQPPLRERPRYSMAASHWAHRPRWVTYEVDGDDWFGFERVRVVTGVEPEIVMIPLAGHSLGHTGIAVRRGDGWLLHCGDAYFNRHEVETPHSCPPALRVFQSLVQANGKLRIENQERLRELAAAHGGDVELICAHDPELLKNRSAPAGA